MVELLNNTELVESRIFRADSMQARLPFALLPTAIYTARLIEDLNANGRWDTGDYDRHLQPEPLQTKKLENLRPNWELEATISRRPQGGRSDKGRGG